MKRQSLIEWVAGVTDAVVVIGMVGVGIVLFGLLGFALALMVHAVAGALR